MGINDGGEMVGEEDAGRFPHLVIGPRLICVMEGDAPYTLSKSRGGVEGVTRRLSSSRLFGAAVPT